MTVDDAVEFLLVLYLKLIVRWLPSKRLVLAIFCFGQAATDYLVVQHQRVKLAYWS